jgi:mono/diheme cytochrome c family protein
MKHAAVLALVLATALAAGCTNRDVVVSATKTRTYSLDIAPITGDQRCYQCHIQNKGPAFADGLKQLGTYDFDRSRKAFIKIMVQVDASAKASPGVGFLSEAQTQTVLDWIEAGMPDDGTPCYPLKQRGAPGSNRGPLACFDGIRG